MFLLVPAHPGFPGQIPQSRKTVVLCVCVCNCMHTHIHTHPFYGSLYFVRDHSGEPVPEKNIHLLTPFVIISHPLSASFIYYDPWHPPCSIYMPVSLFPQSLSKFSLVYLLAWYSPLHTPFMCNCNDKSV